MNIKESINNIIVPALSKRSMMVIWIFLAALLITMASPNVTHEAGFLSTDPQIPLKSLSAPSEGQDLFENMLEDQNRDIRTKENAAGLAPTEPVNPEPVSLPDLPLADEVIVEKIAARVPIITATTTDSAKLNALLDEGVVLYPTSAGFGMVGQTVLLGHSAPASWPNIKHDTAFSRINELVRGDLVEIVYQGRTYVYEVTRSQVISKGEDLAGEDSGKSWLVLVTCWPPGRDRQRVAVETVLIRQQP